MARKPASDVGALLKRVASHPFSSADPDVVAELAKALWHDPDAPVQAQKVLQVALRRPLHRRRALYVLDLFRRFSCVSDEQYRDLQKLVTDNSQNLQLSSPVPAQHKRQRQRLTGDGTRDQVALMWGLREDLAAQLPSTLQYQTRHYSATLGQKTGFTKG